MEKNSYTYDELISCGEGKLFGEGNAKLPLPPMLMFDRITKLKKIKVSLKRVLLRLNLISKIIYGSLIVTLKKTQLCLGALD